MRYEFCEDIRDYSRSIFLCEDSRLLGYRKNMLIENKISNLLECEFNYLNNKCFLEFDKASMISIKTMLLNGDMTKELVITLFKQLISLSDTLKDYFLTIDDVLIDVEQIFYYNVDKKFKFIYLPKSNQAFSEGMVKLSNTVIDKILDRDKSFLSLCYEIKSCYEKNGFIKDMKVLVDGYEKNIEIDRGVYELFENAQPKANTIPESREKPSKLHSSKIEKKLILNSIRKPDRVTNILFANILVGIIILGISLYLDIDNSIIGGALMIYGGASYLIFRQIFLKNKNKKSINTQAVEKKLKKLKSIDDIL